MLLYRVGLEFSGSRTSPTFWPLRSLCSLLVSSNLGLVTLYLALCERFNFAF